MEVVFLNFCGTYVLLFKECINLHFFQPVCKVCLSSTSLAALVIFRYFIIAFFGRVRRYLNVVLHFSAD
jgi:hypothetical protein